MLTHTHTQTAVSLIHTHMCAHSAAQPLARAVAAAAEQRLNRSRAADTEPSHSRAPTKGSAKREA